MKQVNGWWRVTTIILMVLLILGTIFVGWLYSIGTDSINKEMECSFNICGDDNKYDSYNYDMYGEVCYCYIDNEIEYQEYMG